MLLVGLLALGQRHHLVLEGHDGARIDLECEVELERTAARLFGVQVDLPCLAHGVRLDEMPLVVDVEPVIGGVVLQIGDEAGDIEQ